MMVGTKKDGLWDMVRERSAVRGHVATKVALARRLPLYAIRGRERELVTHGNGAVPRRFRAGVEAEDDSRGWGRWG